MTITISPDPKADQLSSHHAFKCREAYATGAMMGRAISSRHAEERDALDMWMILATCVSLLCLLTVAFMHRAKISLQAIESIRVDAMTLMQIKEKELVTEQTQARHLHCLYQEYLTKCHKQVCVIKGLRNKRSTLLQTASEESDKLNYESESFGALKRARCIQKVLLRRTQSQCRMLHGSLNHAKNFVLAGTIFGSMWVSYSFGYITG